MGRLVDVDEVSKYVIIGNGDLRKIPTVEAIPKAEYEARLKTDMVAILEELKEEFKEEKQVTDHLHYDDLENAESYNNGIDNCIDTIQSKIDTLKKEQ